MRPLAMLLLLIGLFLMTAAYSGGLNSLGVFGLLLTALGIAFQFWGKKA